MTAQVHYLSRPARNARGRAVGEHGNRVPDRLREEVVADLWAAANPLTLAISNAAVAQAAIRAGATTRTVRRWWTASRDARIAAAQREAAAAEVATTAEAVAAAMYGDAPTTGDAAAPAGGASPTTTPTATLTAAQPRGGLAPSTLLRWTATDETSGKLTLTDQDIRWIGGLSTTMAAYKVIKASPDHRLHSYSQRAIYRAWEAVHPAVRERLRKGPRESRAQEFHPPRTSTGSLSQSWAVDQYTVKAKVLMPDGSINDSVKVLNLTWEASSLSAAYSILPQAACSNDVRRLVGEAARGWSHEGVSVGGAATWLRCDQGTEFMTASLERALGHLGTGHNPVESYSPAANGSAERAFGLLSRKIDRLPSTTRYVKRRNGSVMETGVISYDALVEAIDAAFSQMRFVEPHQRGEFEGLTAFETHQQLLAAGRLRAIAPRVEDLAAVAVTEATNTYDPSKGVFFRGCYYGSVELAAHGGHEKVRIATLLDETEIFVFTKSYTFIGTARPVEQMTDTDKAVIISGRANRSRRAGVMVSANAAALIADGKRTVREQAAATATSDAPESAATDAGPEYVIEPRTGGATRRRGRTGQRGSAAPVARPMSAADLLASLGGSDTPDIARADTGATDTGATDNPAAGTATRGSDAAEGNAAGNAS